MIFGILRPYEETVYYIYLVVPVNDIQPIWNKICINLQKRMLSPRSNKVPLGSNVDFNIRDNISE